MRQSLKISISFLLSLVIAFLFLLFGASGLFTILETNFYIPKIQKHYEDLLQKIVKEVKENTGENISRFEAILDNPFIPSAFLSDQSKSVSDTKAREKTFASLRERFPDLLFVRFLGENGKKIHFSTLDSDLKSSTSSQRVYYNYDQVNKNIDAARVMVSKESSPKVTLDGDNNVFIYSFPIIDSYDVFKGSALFYVTKDNITRKLLLSPELEIKGDVIIIEDKGVLFNFPQELSSLIKGEVITIWDKNSKNSRFSDTILATLDEEKVTFTLLTLKTDYSGYISLLIASNLFEIPSLYKIIMLILLFFTLYIVIFIIFNVKQDPLLVISRRIKYLQIQFLKQFIDVQEEIDWKKWHSELLTREARIKIDIKKGVGKINKAKENEVDELINKSWNNILSIIARKAEQERPASFDVKKIEEIIKRALKSGNIVIPVQKTKGEEVKKAGQVEEIEEVKEAEAVETIEEVEELDELEEGESGIEEIEEAEVLEEAEEPVEEEVEEAGESGAEEVEEVEIFDEAEEPGTAKIEAVEVLEEAEDTEEIEEIETLGEAEEPGIEDIGEVVEILEEHEEISGLEEVEELSEIDVEEESEEAEEPEDIEEVEEMEAAEEVTEDLVLVSANKEQKEVYADAQKFIQTLPPEPFEKLEELQLAANPDEYTYYERGGKYYLLRKELLKKGGKNGTGKQEQSEPLILFEPLKKTKDETQNKIIPESGWKSEYKTMQEEFTSLVNKNQITFFTLEEIFNLLARNEDKIIMENGVYKINKDMIQVEHQPKDSELKELVDAVKDGISTVEKEKTDYVFAKTTGTEKVLIEFTRNYGIDYDGYLNNFKDIDNLTIMKSLVGFSKDINAFIVGLFTLKDNEYIIDISVGLQEKSRDLFKFSKQDIYSTEIFAKRRICIIYTPLRDIRFLKDKVDGFDKKYISSVLFIPAKYKKKDTYFIFGFSYKLKGSVKDILINLGLRFVT